MLPGNLANKLFKVYFCVWFYIHSKKLSIFTCGLATIKCLLKESWTTTKVCVQPIHFVRNIRPSNRPLRTLPGSKCCHLRMAARGARAKAKAAENTWLTGLLSMALLWQIWFRGCSLVRHSRSRVVGFVCAANEQRMIATRFIYSIYV